MDSKRIYRVNVVMTISVILVFLLTVMPWFNVRFSTGEILDSEISSTLSFDIFSVRVTEKVSVFGIGGEDSYKIPHLEALERLDDHTTDEFIAYDLEGLMESMGVVTIASIAVIAVLMLGMILYHQGRWDDAVFICPYALLVHCLLVVTAPAIIVITYKLSLYSSMADIASFSLSPFLIAAICISVIASVIYFFSKRAAK